MGLKYPNSERILEPLTRQFISNPIPPGDITPSSKSNAATPPIGNP